MENEMTCDGVCAHCDVLGCHFRAADMIPIDEVLEGVEQEGE